MCRLSASRLTRLPNIGDKRVEFHELWNYPIRPGHRAGVLILGPRGETGDTQRDKRETLAGSSPAVGPPELIQAWG